MFESKRWLFSCLVVVGCTARAPGGIINTLDASSQDEQTETDGPLVTPDMPVTPDVPVRVDVPVGVDLPPPGCPGTETSCNGVCTNLNSDPNNCGFCGNACGTGSSCVTGTCTTPTTGAAVGSACTTDAQCGTGGACLAAGSGFPGGYCIIGCASTAMAGDDCSPGDGICLSTGTSLVCWPKCVPGTSGVCRSGYVCQSVTTDNSEGYCLPDCNSNPAAVCGAFQCETATGLCAGLCTTAATCTAGSTCNATTMYCDCSSTTNCGSNARCFPAATTGGDSFCGCANSTFCPVGSTCNTTTGSCS